MLQFSWYRFVVRRYYLSVTLKSEGGEVNWKKLRMLSFCGFWSMYAAVVFASIFTYNAASTYVRHTYNIFFLKKVHFCVSFAFTSKSSSWQHFFAWGDAIRPYGIFSSPGLLFSLERLESTAINFNYKGRFATPSRKFSGPPPGLPTWPRERG